MTAPLRPPALRWWTLAVVCISTFMLMLDLSVVSIALPSIHTSLQAGFSAMQWVFDAYALTLAAFLVTAGSIADRSGRKPIFLGGLLLFTAASLACGLAGNIDVLNISRGVQGVGAAIMFAVGPALLGNVFHGKERATAFGMFGASVGVAAASGPLIGGALTGGPGWRWIFFLNVPVGLVTLLAAAWQLRDSRRLNSPPPDIAGMITFTVSLGALALAIIRGNDDGWFSWSNIALYVVSALSLGLFLLVARSRGQQAMFDPAMFRSRTFIGFSVVTFLANACGFVSLFIETTYFQRVLFASAWVTGLRFLPLTLAMFVMGGLGGALIGKLPFRVLMATAMTALGIGMVLILLSNSGNSWTALIPSMIAVGVAIGLYQPIRAALAIGVAEPARAGVASGINETFQQVGMAMGIAAFGALFANRVSSAFLHSATGARLGPLGRLMAPGISAGSLQPPPHTVPPGLAGQVIEAGRTAFTTGLHQTAIVLAVGGFVAALIAATTLREKDLHESARTTVPPDVADETGVDELEPAEAPAATQH
jgi:EmrB/QacA subfamily drug resistance transporter